jgi:hypothetical protein
MSTRCYLTLLDRFSAVAAIDRFEQLFCLDGEKLFPNSTIRLVLLAPSSSAAVLVCTLVA